jgi:nitronate monooxygenase
MSHTFTSAMVMLYLPFREYFSVFGTNHPEAANHTNCRLALPVDRRVLRPVVDTGAVDVLDRLQLDVPVVQAGMGGGLARAELAAAVSAAGGLGTVGMMPPKLLRRELRDAQDRAPGHPVALNLLLPFVKREHVTVCTDIRPATVVLFCGFDAALVAQLHEAQVTVLHQVGSAAGARKALSDGADGLIVQGLEAGGHVLASEPLTRTLPAVLAVAGGKPVLAAGGIIEAADTRVALAAGADAVVAGTRFLLTEECQAHPAYQRKVLEADETVLTRLFGLGWRDPHRVVPNAAVRRWCRVDGSERPLPRWLGVATLPVARHAPMNLAARVVPKQRVGVPLFSPSSLLRGQDERLVEVTPLYAGTAAARVSSVIPAAEAVRRLAP